MTGMHPITECNSKKLTQQCSHAIVLYCKENSLTTPSKPCRHLVVHTITNVEAACSKQVEIIQKQKLVCETVSYTILPGEYFQATHAGLTI